MLITAAAEKVTV